MNSFGEAQIEGLTVSKGSRISKNFAENWGERRDLKSTPHLGIDLFGVCFNEAIDSRGFFAQVL